VSKVVTAVDAFQCKAELIFGMSKRTAILRAPVHEDSQQGYFLFLEKGNHPIIQQTSGHQH
jgi:hypothetical protein